MSATTSSTAGLKLLEAVKFDYRLTAVIIISRPDSEQEELLDSIPMSNQRRNVAAIVAAIRSSLGMDASYALECQGRE